MIIVMHLAAKEPGISLRSGLRPKKELKESEHWTENRCPETLLQINANVSVSNPGSVNGPPFANMLALSLYKISVLSLFHYP